MDVPLTVKMRAGVHDKSWNAHSLVPLLRQWGVALVTVHGRSREQRYTKLADYDYIDSCATAASPMPLYGGEGRGQRGEGRRGEEGWGRECLAVLHLGLGLRLAGRCRQWGHLVI